MKRWLALGVAAYIADRIVERYLAIRWVQRQVEEVDRIVREEGGFGG